MEELMNKWKKRMQDTKPCRCIRFNQRPCSVILPLESSCLYEATFLTFK